jgi:hypothetical protein
MAEQQAPHDQFSKLFAQTRERLIKGVAVGLGGKARDAVGLSPDDEIAEYTRPTSPAALKALEMGAPIEEAYRANAMWANQLKTEQAQIRAQGQQAGMTPEQIHAQLQQAELTDDQIFKACLGQAWELARANGKDDAKATAAYHERILQRIAARQQKQKQQAQPTYETLPGEEG